MRNIALFVLLAFGVPASAGADDCSGQELPPGMKLADGSVAGEKQALNLFQKSEKELYKQLSDLSAQNRRERFAAQFAWFQREGNCRSQQKRLSIRQLKAEMELDSLLRKHKSEQAEARELKIEKAGNLAPLEKKIREMIAERVNTDIAALEYEKAVIDQALEDYGRQAEGLRAKIADRKSNREVAIDKKLKELTK